ncbi:MAG: response regulator transcription factor [Candidatus Sericytochromatia bacterium]|nr:response regulator transcription factor [Candidatus Tanganyikabacteria bacterium]
MTDRPIRVLLIDDHALIREGLRAVLSAREGLEVVGEAPNGAQGLALVQDLHPDVVLMDISMPAMSGIEATEAIARTAPDVRVLGLTVHENPEYFTRMLSAGAAGYVLKGATSEELVSAIRSVFLGGIYLTAGMAGFLGKACSARTGEPAGGRFAPDGLTPREGEILELMAKGRTNHEIAELLHLSVSTVQTHRANMVRKLGLESNQHLIMYAIRKYQPTLDAYVEKP